MHPEELNGADLPHFSASSQPRTAVENNLKMIWIIMGQCSPTPSSIEEGQYRSVVR